MKTLNLLRTSLNHVKAKRKSCYLQKSNSVSSFYKIILSINNIPLKAKYLVPPWSPESVLDPGMVNTELTVTEMQPTPVLLVAFLEKIVALLSLYNQVILKMITGLSQSPSFSTM